MNSMGRKKPVLNLSGAGAGDGRIDPIGFISLFKNRFRKTEGWHKAKGS